jgi:regulator of protease activity HflC (stomatin/prohibitin superfamily)
MKPFLIVGSLLVAGYLATGLYIVRGNEKVAVRRFGRVVRTPEGSVSLVASGLHYTLPWPCSEIERINLNEVRTLSIGMGEIAEPGAGGFLRSLEAENQSQFLTGDKNILHLQINSQYRLAERSIDDFLFRSVAPERHLERIVEAVATGLIARSGVDFVHPLGQVELNALLTSEVRRIAEEQRLGLDVDDVAINAVYPPILVKAYFLDVTSARADKINSINEGLAYAESRHAAARSEARRTLDEAASYRGQTIESARAQAESFSRLIEQFRREEQSGGRTYVQARQIALARRYYDTMRDILKTVSAKVLLDSGEPADLTIFTAPASAAPAPAAAPQRRTVPGEPESPPSWLR